MRLALLLFALLATGCQQPTATQSNESASKDTSVVDLRGMWIRESTGEIMSDPQTSGLSVWRNQLISISDGSAQESQRRRLHRLNAGSGFLSPPADVFSLSQKVRQSCFDSYLQNQPDYEAIVVDPRDENVMYIVTEDATRTGTLSARCQKKFANSGSTDYPTLLLRLKAVDDNQTLITHVRPLRFAAEYEVGNFPNDGIEGLAMTPEGLLYLGLEKDKAGQARVFQVALNEEFWAREDFANVVDSELVLPSFVEGNHPINGMTWYRDDKENREYLMLAARNDDEIWVVDTQTKQTVKQVALAFYAPTDTESCPEWESMDNSSIEGLAVMQDVLYLVNDPWKRNYKKNISCSTNAPFYQAMAPLLFSVPVSDLL